MSREKSEKVCITFRLSEEEHEKLKQYSSACGLSTAEFMRQLCRGNAPQPQPEKEFWELLGTLYEVHVAFKKCIPYALPLMKYAGRLRILSWNCNGIIPSHSSLTWKN